MKCSHVRIYRHANKYTHNTHAHAHTHAHTHIHTHTHTHTHTHAHTHTRTHTHTQSHKHTHNHTHIHTHTHLFHPRELRRWGLCTKRRDGMIHQKELAVKSCVNYVCKSKGCTFKVVKYNIGEPN